MNFSTLTQCKNSCLSLSCYDVFTKTTCTNVSVCDGRTGLHDIGGGSRRRRRRVHNGAGERGSSRQEWVRLQSLQNRWKGKGLFRKAMEGPCESPLLQHLHVGCCGPTRMGFLGQTTACVRIYIYYYYLFIIFN